MNVIAIDPGTEQSAVVQWDGERVITAEIQPNAFMADSLAKGWMPNGTMLAVEMVASYGMPVGREVFETCVWIGRFVQAWHSRWFAEHRFVYRREVKIHHCGSMKAKDSNIRQALIDKYGHPGTKMNPGKTYGLKADLWSAFAIATYVTETTKP